MSGTGTVEYLMSYLPSGIVKFIGLEVLTGAIGGRSGTVVMQHDGVFLGGRARSTWSFVEGSGSGDLINLHGSGSYESIDQQTVSYSNVRLQLWGELIRGLSSLVSGFPFSVFRFPFSVFRFPSSVFRFPKERSPGPALPSVGADGICPPAFPTRVIYGTDGGWFDACQRVLG